MAKRLLNLTVNGRAREDAVAVAEIAVTYTSKAAGGPGAGAALATLFETLPAHRRPRWMYEVAHLPRTPTGKLLRRKVRELHATRTAAAA